jgi:hypothetical protein
MEKDSVGYVARIRWRSQVNADWEVDTFHRRFETWEEAACFANGLGAAAAAELVLRAGAFALRLVNGQCSRVAGGDVVAWHRELGVPAGEGAADMAFVRVVAGPGELSRLGLDGAFEAHRFGVDQIGEAKQLDVRVEADAERRTVRITLEAGAIADEERIAEDFLEVLGRTGKA